MQGRRPHGAGPSCMCVGDRRRMSQEWRAAARSRGSTASGPSSSSASDPWALRARGAPQPRSQLRRGHRAARFRHPAGFHPFAQERRDDPPPSWPGSMTLAKYSITLGGARLPRARCCSSGSCELQKDHVELAPYPMERHGFGHPDRWLDEYKRVEQVLGMGQKQERGRARDTNARRSAPPGVRTFASDAFATAGSWRASRYAASPSRSTVVCARAHSRGPRRRACGLGSR